jgi:carboxyl-terminal processing protease
MIEMIPMMDVPVPEKRESQAKQSVFTVQMFVMLALVAGVAFVAGVWFANSTDSPHDNQSFQVFWQSWDILEREHYYDLPANTELIHAALRGLFAQVGDRYTFFASPAVAEINRQRTAGEFGGIGAYVSQNESGQLVIVRPFDGLPADKAGLQTNDVILEINGTSIEGMPLDNALELLRGEIGTDITLTIYRPGTDTRFTVEIKRARVELPVTDAAMYGSVGYIALASFNQKATDSLKQDIADLQEQGAQALILDLRGNPGGLLDQAIGVSDLFLGEGVVVTQQDRQGEQITYRAGDGDLAESIPLVVLIDGGSASASEVVAGALRDHDRAILIGQKSFGKGSVQHVYDMSDGSQVHVTFAVWLTPDNILIDGKGLEPDITVTIPENSDSDQDPFIEAALAYFEETGIPDEG